MTSYYQNDDDFGSQTNHLAFNDNSLSQHQHQQQQQQRYQHSLLTSNSYDEALDSNHDSYNLAIGSSNASNNNNNNAHNLPSSQRFSTPSDFSPSSSSEFGPDPLNPEHFPTEEVFQSIIDDYLNNLSERKREKALITQEMYDNVLLILQDPRNTSTSTAQFRFWAKKMFAILEYKGEFVVTHDKRPVAVKEQIYDVLVYCHGQASHGGRDKTSSMVSLLLLLVIAFLFSIHPSRELTLLPLGFDSR